jgi:hypothetical protein
VNQELSTGDTLVVAPGIKNYESATQESIDEHANGNTVEISKGSSGLPPITGPNLMGEALYGLAGDIVKAVDQYTEADPAAVLVNVLVMFGNVIGRKAYFKVEETLHYTNLFTALSGPSSTGRKGQSQSTPKRIFKTVEEQWVNNSIVSGLSSGEGIIHKIRDENPEVSPPDGGVTDKRVLCVEEEFAQALKVMKREGNILSPILRQAWDGSPLQPLTKTSPIRCKEPHLSIIGHITPEELRKQLNEIEIANGFANRFMWFYVQRSKLIASPKGVPAPILQPLMDELVKAVNFGRSTTEVARDPQAEELWQQVYPQLTSDRFGLFGVITQRAAPQVLRLSMIYALMDCSYTIDLPHLRAALALWEYSEQSVKMIFEEMTGDQNVDLVVKCGKVFKSITRGQLWGLIGRNIHKDELDRIASVINTRKLANIDPQQTLIFK